MATEAAVSSALEKISRNHLECSICQEKYQKPKVLDCQHSFCEECLVKYHTTQHKDAKELPCPMCRRQTQLPETGVQGLKTNFFIIGLAEDFAVQEKVASCGDKKPICKICDEGSEATYRCLDCAKNICSKCKKMHLQFAELLSHTISSLEEIRQGKVSLQRHQHKHQPKCRIHEGEVTRFFCTTCEKLICRDCTVIDHCKPQHTYIDSTAAAATCKRSVYELCAPLEGALNEFMKSLETISTVKRELDTTVERTVKEVRKTAADVRADITAQENHIIDEIRRLHKDRNEKLQECEKTMGMMTEGIKYSLETAKDVTSTASDSDFLSLYSTISKDLTFLASQNPPAVDQRLAFLKFKRSQGTGGINLGKLQKEKEWGQLCEFGKEGSGLGEFRWTRGIAGLEQDEIAVADYYNKRVVICSTTGCQNSAIPFQASSLNHITADPSDVAATRTHDRMVVVFSNATDVKLFNKDRTLAFEFPTVPRTEVGKTTVELSSVAVKADGTIVVGDVEREVLTEHSPTDGSLIRTIPVQRAPRHIAVDCSERVVISDWNQEVEVTDGNGTTLFTIKPTIESKQVECCTGVCWDSSGIYIAMHNNADNTGHVHHYDTMGNYLCCMAKGLYMPQGITFTADGQQLVVADWDSVKIYHNV